MCPIWFLNVDVKLLPFIMLNVETESTKINILSSQLLIFLCISMDYMLVKFNERRHSRLNKTSTLIHVYSLLDLIININ